MNSDPWRGERTETAVRSGRHIKASRFSPHVCECVWSLLRVDNDSSASTPTNPLFPADSSTSSQGRAVNSVGGHAPRLGRRGRTFGSAFDTLLQARRLKTSFIFISSEIAFCVLLLKKKKKRFFTNACITRKKKKKEELFTAFLRPVSTGRERKNNFTVLKGH